MDRILLVTTWNILADEWTKGEQYPISVDNRYKIIKKNLIEMSSDIYLLQEVQQNMYMKICEDFLDNYFISPIVQNINGYWGSDMKFNIGLIIMVSKKIVCPSIIPKFAAVLLSDSGNVGAYSDITVISNGKETPIRLYNIHLDDINQNERIMQLGTVSRHSCRTPSVIIGGDFNEPDLDSLMELNPNLFPFTDGSIYVINNKYKDRYIGGYTNGYTGGYIDNGIVDNNPLNISNGNFICTYFDAQYCMNLDRLFLKGLSIAKIKVKHKKNIFNLKSALIEYGSDHIPVITAVNI